MTPVVGRDLPKSSHEVGVAGVDAFRPCVWNCLYLNPEAVC